MVLLDQSPLPVLLSGRCHSNTKGEDSADATRAVTRTVSPGAGTAGECMSPSTWGAGSVIEQEFAAPGVPRSDGTGSETLVAMLWSQVCAIRRDAPETQRASKLIS